MITQTLMEAKRPLVITGYLGRNPRSPKVLAELCDKLPISVLETVGSDMCIRSDHEAYLGVTITTHDAVREADVILVIDCDVPWIPTAGRPRSGEIYMPTHPSCLSSANPSSLQMPRFSTSTWIR